MKAVIDTNIIVASISRKSPYRIITDKLFEGGFQLVVSTEILLEYEEKMAEIFSPETADNFISALLLLPYVIRAEPLFFSRLLPDSDDNKFLDIYYSSQADCLVTNDKHFAPLKKIRLPQHHVLNIHEFIKLLKR
jgi:uncharacterized protein